MPRLNDITRGILGNHYDDVSSYLSNPFNLPSLSGAGLVTLADARRAATNPNITDETELKILRGRTQATRSILDRGVSVDDYYERLTNFYSTDEGLRLGRDIDVWSRDRDVSQTEITAMSRRVFDSAAGGMTRAELSEIRRTMNAQDDPAPRRDAPTRRDEPRNEEPAPQRRNNPPTNQPRQPEVENPAPPTAEQPAAVAATVAAEPTAPPEPPRYTPPNQLDTTSYDALMLTIGAQMRQLMPEGMSDGLDMNGFLEDLEDPAFRNRFIELYNTDPQYRQAIVLLHQDADRLVRLSERSGDRELDPNSEAGRRAGVLQGQFRTLIGNSNDLLDVNKVMELQQGVSGLANFAGSMSGMIDQMPPWLRGFITPILESFDIVSRAFSREGVRQMGEMAQNAFGGIGFNTDGLSFAGNGGGLMDPNGPLGSLLNAFTGGGANAGTATGAPAPTALANNDANNRVPPAAAPSLGQNGPGAPVNA